MTILAATAWRTNAELIRDVHLLGYLRDEDHVVDPTHGRGTWWKAWRPEKLTTHNRKKDGSDFRSLPYPDGTFDAAAFDPAYVAKGGRATSGIKEMDSRYGQDDAPRTPALLQELIDDGLTEMHRIVKPGGIVLCKCKDYISSGRLWLGTHHTLTHALSLGFECVDRLEHLSGTGPQPRGRRQMHARRNLSTLLVLRKPSGSPRRAMSPQEPAEGRQNHYEQDEPRPRPEGEPHTGGHTSTKR